MPFTSDVIHEINVYLQKYVTHKTTGSDIAQKQKEINRIQSLITTAKLKKTPDADWIPILLEIGKTADDSQRKGTYCSKFTETLYMVLHRLRREINKDVLRNAVHKEMIELSALKAKYVQAKKANQKIEALQEHEQEIENRICKLVHLGELDPLLELDLDEAGALFSGTVKKSVPFQFVYKLFTNELEEIKGYEYSDATTIYAVTDVNTTLPLVVQHGENLTFEKIYLAKYLNNVRPEPKEDATVLLSPTPPSPARISITPIAPESKLIQMSPLSLLDISPSNFELKRPESKEPISDSFALELTNDLNNYTLGKTHGFDLALKIKECNEISTLITSHSQKKASTDEWLDLVITIGEQADRIQNSGRTCSGCTEVFYYILHKLRQELAKNAPATYTARLEKENQELVKLQTKSKQCKWGNEKPASLEQAESAIHKARRRLGYLGNLDALLNLKQAKFDKMYSGTCNDILVGPIVHYFSGTPILGFEYPRTPNIYDLPHTFCTYLPVVLQTGFVDFYLKKYEAKLKTVANAKIATESAEKAIKDLELKIKQLSESKNIELITRHQRDEKALAEAGLTPDEVNKTIAEPIKQIELSIETTRKYILLVLKERKEEFSKILNKNMDDLSILKNSLITVLKTFELAQQEKNQLKVELESKAYDEAKNEIARITDKISQLIAEPNNLQILNVHDKEINLIKEANVTEKEVNALNDAINFCTASIHKIKELIATSQSSKQEILTSLLTSQIDKLKPFEKALSQIQLKLTTTAAEVKDSATPSIINEEKGMASQASILSILQQQNYPTPVPAVVIADEYRVLDVDSNPEPEEVPEYEPLHTDDAALFENDLSSETKDNSVPEDDASTLQAEIVAVLADTPDFSESKNSPTPLMGKELRLELFEKIAEKRGTKEQNKQKKFLEWEREFSKDKSIIQKFLKELSEAGNELEEDFAVRALA